MSRPAEMVVKHQEGLIKYSDLKLGKKLGQGGFGVVYQGIWRMTDVAIKELIPERLTPESSEEFEVEAQTMKNLRHPNIVQFYGFCVSPKYCIVMEYMPNGSLFHLLHNNQTLQWDMRMRIAIEMAKGLIYLHEENIVHRDIKSLNVLLDEHYKARLTDFGLSKVKTETRSVSTKSSQSVGTIPWMAPELFSRRAVFTKKSDIYSLGITFWELASRDIPFKDAASAELIPMWVAKGEREDIPKDCPEKLASLIKACWEGEPNKRPDAITVAEFLLSKEMNFASFLPSYKAQASQAALPSAYQDNLQSAAAAAAAASSDYYDNQYSASPIKTAASQSPEALITAFQQKVQIAANPSPAPRVDARELSAFLKLIAEGEQDSAEALLKKNPLLALMPTDVTDLAGRTFRNITGFQYAVWALDWYMWTMIRKYLPLDAAREQMERMKTGSWVQQHGTSISWQNLIDALQKYINLCNEKNWLETGAQWNIQVGGAQRLLPAHVINEYCRPDRPFEPRPDFNSTLTLPRTRNTDEGEWYTAIYNYGKLGNCFAYSRYSFDKAALGYQAAGCGRRVGAVLCATADFKACHTLLNTRVQQRDQLFAELLSHHQPQHKAGAR